ncbi:iron chelate uptake ABC transporter family permease subunit [Klebsiella pneumoniae]|uniref:iron chelate uptake ABC transporter family permease subunit n=2 Tax=Klebsiella pneumoniae TaxID=573 RepID=UPI000E2A92E8|nr:putative ABC transport system periplasmic binding component [Klebsiella pneumoniae]
MSKHPLLLGLTLLSASLFTGQAFADRTVTDQLGRQVTLPDHVTRVVVLQHQTLNLLVQLHAAEDIVGVLSSWKKQLGPQFARFMPEIGQLATPGDLTQVNIESLLALRPQVVFVANYAPPAMIAQIQQAGIPVVAISLRHDAAGEKNKMNPTMADEEQAYNAGLMEGIRLIGEVVERQPEAEALIHYTFEARKQANAPVADIPPNQRVRVYMANPDLNTYGAGKYTGLMMAHAGALNVAAASVKGARQVSLEQVLEWNPQVIFVQDRYPQVVKQIENDPQWQTIDAVKHHRVWLMPEYAKAWGYPMPEALALVTLAIAVASLCFGQYPLSLSAVGHTLVHLPPGEGVIGQIVWSVRLPRVVMALLAGGALGLCGATLQGVFQNPLVDPHIIGVTAGSAFGGTLAILLGVGSLLMMASTFFFGLVALGLIYALAALQGRDSTLGLILSGIILSGFFAALVSLMQYLADSEETLPNIVFWLLGSFATASWHKVLLMSLPLAVAAGALWKLRWRINLLALEERDARSLGVPVAALRRGVLVCCAVLVAAQVAVSGSIAWMGLVVPHLARLLVGADHRRLLPTAFWLGAALMLVVDDLARTLTQAEIPIGIITALLGAPLFTVLLVQSRRRSTTR